MDSRKQEYIVVKTIPYGHQNAITSKEIAKRTNLCERKVRDIISSLIQKEYYIGSSSRAGEGGYFIINTREDLDVALENLIPRAVKIFDRVRSLKRIAKDKFGMQIRLFKREIQELTGKPVYVAAERR